MKPSIPAISNPAPATIGVLARVRRALGLEAPSREEIRRRIRSKPGIFDSLTPEALEYIRNYDGPENMGPPPDEPKPGFLARVVEWIADDAPSPRWTRSTAGTASRRHP